MSSPRWEVDPDDPRAPPQEIWDALSPAERKRIVDSLPGRTAVREVNELLALVDAILERQARAIAAEIREQRAKARIAELRAEIERLRAELARLQGGRKPE